MENKEEIKKNKINFFSKILTNNIFYFIILIIISALISIFISYIFLSNNLEKVEPIIINVDIADTNANMQESFITKSIEENINKLYDRSISNLNTSILLFSTCLGIFTILFGVFYISKINEIQKEINNIKSLPEEVFKKFYKQKLKDDVNNLLSDNPTVRNIAIKGLSNNTEITKNDFNLLETVFDNEIKSKGNVFFQDNINIIVSILLNLKQDETIKKIIDYIKDDNNDFMKRDILIKFLFVYENDEIDTFIREYLKKDNEISNRILFTIINNNFIEKYIYFILEECSSIIASQMFSIMNLGMVFLNNIKDILHNMLEKDKNIFSVLDYIIATNCLSNTDKISLLLYDYSVKNIKLSGVYLSSYYYKIKNDNKLLTEFENIYNTEYHDKINFKDFQEFKNKVLINEDREKNHSNLDRFR